MNVEKVISMCTEKSIDINDVPGGGIPDFTAEDARHALGHMRKEAFDYCEYVFLLYGEKPLFALTENTILYIAKEYPVIAHKKDSELLIKLCRMACKEQLAPAGKISHAKRYVHLGLERHIWRYQWEYIFVYAQNYLNGLREEVLRHIYIMTKQEG